GRANHQHGEYERESSHRIISATGKGGAFDGRPIIHYPASKPPATGGGRSTGRLQSLFSRSYGRATEPGVPGARPGESAAAGSALGGLTRWGVTLWFQRTLGPAFPWGTLFINVSGSLFLGWFATVLSEKLVLSETAWVRPDDLRLLVAIGFTGAYTTFSTFE